MKKFLLAALVGIASMLIPAGVANAATKAPEGHWAIFEQNGKYWYALDSGTSNGEKYLNKGIYEINGKNYAFDSEGYLASKGWYYSNGYYMINSQGSPITGWLQVNDDWYYFDPQNDGKANYYGWYNIDGYDYYFYSDGRLATNALISNYGYNYDKNIKENLYYLTDKEGRVIYEKGWHYRDKECYYVTDTGKGYVLTEQWVGQFFVGSNGKMLKDGACAYKGNWNGQVIYTSSKDKKKYDYKTGTYFAIEYTGEIYRFGNDGRYVRGWCKYTDYSGTKRYLYCYNNGLVYDGWLKWDGLWYYVESGAVLSNVVISEYSDGNITRYYTSTGSTYSVSIDGTDYTLTKIKSYRLAEDGRMITGWYQEADTVSESYYSAGRWFYSDKDGSLYNGWLQKGKDYYYIIDGVMQRDTTISFYKSEDGKYTNVNSNYTYDQDGNRVNLTLDYNSYFKPDGTMLVGWYQRNGSYAYAWIYARSSGRLVSDSWENINGKQYYFGSYSLITNSVIKEYISEDGTVVKYNRSYYYDENGNEVYLKYNGSYYADEDGAIKKGWIAEINNIGNINGYMYAGQDGKLVENDWVCDDGKYYYMNNTEMLSDQVIYQYASLDKKFIKYLSYFATSYYTKDADGNTVDLYFTNAYYLDDDGALADYGWIYNEYYDEWYYAKSNGYLVYNNWIEYKGDYYYFNGIELHTYTNKNAIYDVYEYASEDGKIVKYNSSSYIDKDGTSVSLTLRNKYAVDYEGKMITGWYRELYNSGELYESWSSWRYALPSGVLANGWTKIGNDWYYFSNGCTVSGIVYLGNLDKSISETFLNAYPEPKLPANYDSLNIMEKNKISRITMINHDVWMAKYDAYMDDNTYVFDTYGKLIKGWANVALSSYYSSRLSWVYADKNGHPYTGWIKENGNDYYINNGVMVYDCYINGYYINHDGICVA